MDRRTLLLGTLGASMVAACSRTSPDRPGPNGARSSSTTPPTAGGPVNPVVTEEIATGLNVPWSLVFLADGSALVSQRDTATILRIGDGSVTEVGVVPTVARRQDMGEGGLLGLAVVPGDESVLYARITTATDDRVVSMDFDGGSLGAPQPVLTGIPSSRHHHGGSLLVDPEGHLFVSTGDAEQPRLAQDLGSLAGKILRITTDGQAAPGNPHGTMVFSHGHRNVEGLAFDADGRLWASEFGDKGADELNLISPGGNYGWPDVEGEDPTGATMTPKVTWPTADCSPAGLAITRGTAFLGALQGRCLFSVPLNGETAGQPQAHFSEEYGRIRAVAVAPDGSLWMSTSNTDGRRDPGPGDDRILRVTL